MKLKKVHIKNFRSIKDAQIEFQDDLTVLIGENNAGKSSLLDLLECTLNNFQVASSTQRKYPEEADYTLDPASNQRADSIEITSTFQLSPDECLAQGSGSDQQSSRQSSIRADWIDQNRYLSILVRYSRLNQGMSVEVYNVQQGVWESVDRLQGLRNLPRIVRYRAIDYQSPEKFISKTLEERFASICKQYGDLAKDFIERAKAEMDTEVAKLREYIAPFVSSAGVGYEPRINLEKAFQGGEFQLNLGFGEHALSRTGDGVKRQLLMGLMTWRTEILQGVSENLIWAYDEPDTNLDYHNQRRFFRLIYQQARNNSNQQVVLCTHSLVMIDNAPIRCLVHLKLESGETKVTSIPHGSEDELTEFRNIVGQNLGLTNARLFFERSFLVVEGETEETAIPVLYRKWRKQQGEEHTLADDGIVCLGVRGIFSKILFKFLNQRVPNGVTILCDKEWEGQVSDTLREVGASQGWLVTVGTKEFEDAFCDEIWARVCNKNWPRQDQHPWMPEHIAQIRSIGDKFSEKLRQEIQQQARIRGGLSKPEIGRALAEEVAATEIPQEIQNAFQRALGAARSS